MGGWRYITYIATHGHAAHFETALIWRCDKTSIQGDSGSLLVRLEEDLNGGFTVYGVGFQSHETPQIICPVGTSPQVYWKIALNPPPELTTAYWALAPSDLIDVLENDTRELLYFSSKYSLIMQENPQWSGNDFHWRDCR